MSNLISSFIIEPVFRQARRFSGVRPTSSTNSAVTAAAAEDPQSHAQPDEGPDGSHGTHSTPAHGDRGEEDNARNGPLDSERETGRGAPHRYLIRASRTSLQPAAPVAPPAHPASDRTLSNAENAARAPLPDSAIESDMSYNPSYGLPERFRSMESLNSVPASQGSISVVGHSTDTTEGERSRASSGGSGNNAPIMSEPLPADDGMRLLRQRIHQIRDMKVSTEEKARRMHVLMTERYSRSQAHFIRPHSPLSIISLDRPCTPASMRSALDSEINLSSPVSWSHIDPENPYNVTDEDLLPSYRPTAHGEPGNETGVEEEEDNSDEDGPSLGCKHYKRNVKIQCFDCRQWFLCRHCHDEVETHRLERKKTRNMLCMLCATPQPAGEFCNNCSIRTAWYYCDICKLWDDDTTKHIYHCPDCGICRRGEGIGKDYFHCKKCNVCIAISFASSHRCIERATDCDCPICGEYLFNSSASVVSMPCGHYLHRTCYDQYMQHAYKCPICKKSAVNMELQWRKLDNAIETQPMPAQFKDTRVMIQCNDCEGKSEVPYHWLGNKCDTCDSYNTNEVRLLGGPQAEHDPPSENSVPARPTAVPQRQAPSPPRPSLEARSPGSYFLGSPERLEDRSRPNSAVESSLSAQMLQRVSRSLSPLRNYLGRPGDSPRRGPQPAPVDENDQVDFWGADGGRFLSGEEDEDDEDEDGSSGESMDDEENDEVDDEDDDADEGDDILEGIELIGHR